MNQEITAADISVIIPLYNRASKLRETLNCIYSQTQRPGEIVIVDDGSADNPEAVIHSLDDPTIRFIRQPNGGPGKARNTALAMASGRIAAFLDSDDSWLPTKLEKQIARWNELARANANCVLLDTFIASASRGAVKWYRKMIKSGASFEGLLVENTINGTSSVICEREAVLEAGGFPEHYRFAEDRFVWLSLARKGGCYTVPEVLVMKNHEDDNLTGDLENNLQQKFAFIHHVEKVFDVPHRLKSKMKLWALADFLMVYWRRGNHEKSAEIGHRMQDCGDLHLLVSHPKALAALIMVMGRQRLHSLLGGHR